MQSFVRTRGVTRLLFTCTLLLCACGAPVVLRGPAASPSLVEGPLPVKLSIQAVDPSGGALTYSWQQVPASPGGTFSDPTSSNPTWLAPVVKSATIFTLQVTVTDTTGGSTQAEVKVTVQPPEKRRNRAPVLAGNPVVTPSLPRAGDTLTFTVQASDPDGDALTYLWHQVGPAPRGTFVSSADGASVTWFSPAVGAETAFSLEVLVSDGHGAQVRGTVTVPVRLPRYAEDIQSLWDSLCTGCHGKSGGLELAPGKSHPALVGVHAETKACGSFMRVDPGNPEGSALLMKLSGTGCGSRMPRNNPTYFDAHPDELVRIRSWILGGAKKD
jgi:Big-like domain-containing protein/K319-like protein